MGSDSKMYDSATIVREHEKDKEQTEGCRRDDKEVSGNQIVHVIFQEEKNKRQKMASMGKMEDYRRPPLNSTDSISTEFL